MKSLGILLLFVVSLASQAQFKNIKLTESREGLRTGDPSIIINHRNPDNIVVGAGRDQVIFTTDKGQTWIESTLYSPLGVAGNPSMIIDAKGRIYDFHRSDSEGKGEGSIGWLDRIVCQRSDDLGRTWTAGTSIGGSQTLKSDRQTATVNALKQILYITWTQFDQYPSESPHCQSNIVFSKATNVGSRWDKPIAISQTPGDCSNDDNSAAGAKTAVGIDGRIYVTWSNQGVIFFDRSYDDGNTWLFNDLAIAKQEGGWVLDIPGYGRTHNTPSLLIDNSPSRYHGMLFLTFADQQVGAEDTDIWILRSARSGDSWSEPLRVNSDEPGKHQFCPSVAIDQTTGHLFVVYLDRREHSDNQTDVYLAYSTDSGTSFRDVKISETSFVPTETEFFEHTGISAHNGIVTPVWSRIDSGRVSVWTSIITLEQLQASSSLEK